MNDQLGFADLERIDPALSALIAAEEERQREKIILIPSESLTPPAVREALGSVFTSVYAEGYPRGAMRMLPPELLGDIEYQLAGHRRYADWRFYKGTEFADLVESLAGRRAAECFATPDYPPARIYANVQPLSGAAANLAVYEAFVKPGETVMGMALTEGGHLTHGSEFNITGKRYRIVSYSSDPTTGKLDYDKIMALAEEHRPKMIIAGFTSFPWQPDWRKFREIADSVGAILFADIAHTAGMVVAGVYPNPIGYADVVVFTTHKTLCGPRGAVILSTDPKIAARIDSAIFPGEQGGPHVNKFAAIAAALKIAQTEEFKALQRRIVENAGYLARALQAEGLTLAYGGTDTHLLLVDLRAIESDTGYTMLGEIAARILDLVGIVCNKNTIPGDHSAADAHGIRLGTPWPTQRGMGKEEMEILAGIIARVLREIRPFEYPGLTGPLPRGKIPGGVLQEARRAVRELIHRVDPQVSAPAPRDDWKALRVRGGRARQLLDQAGTGDVSSLPVGEARGSLLFGADGKLIAPVLIGCVGEHEFYVFSPAAYTGAVREWLVGLSDGYILFDSTDIFRKIEGPAVVEGVAELPEQAREWEKVPLPPIDGGNIGEIYRAHPELFSVDKPYFIGQELLDLPAAPEETFSWQEREGELKRTPLHGEHKRLGAKLVPFAGWEMPVWYTSAIAEHRAVRERAGLFDLGHMGVFAVEGENATAFLNAVTANYADWLHPGESQYSYLFDPDGNVIDDIMIYRRGRDSYLVVVNAANEEKDWEWLIGVNEGRYLIDRRVPSRRVPRAALRDLKREEGMVDIALQGPASPRIISKILDEKGWLAVSVLKRTEFCEVDAAGHHLIIARTGYTGEDRGYEIYVAGEDALWLWTELLAAGEGLGLVPCGLAARDSTRTEAGLPLYGHELAGRYGINPFEAGFGPYVKLHKPFFIGRERCVGFYTDQTREIVRFEAAAGTRPVRVGAAVIDRNGNYLGRVTSCVALDDRQVGLALLEKRGLAPGTSIGLINPPRTETVKPIAELANGDRVAVPVPGAIIDRFPRWAAKLKAGVGE